MGHSQVFRASTPRAVGAATMVFSLACLASLAIAGSGDAFVRAIGPLGLLGLFAYAGLWASYVEVSDGGVTVRNIIRTVHVTWPSIEDIDGRYGLRLQTAHGRVTAWAAPAPAGRERLTGHPSEAAQVVQQYLDRLRGQGHLDHPRLEHETADVTWHREIIAAGVALVALTALAPLLF